MFGLFSTSILIAIAAGAVGALTLEHGWGWVLAQYHARANKAQADAKNLYTEVQGQLDSLLAPIKTDVATLKADVAALKSKPAA